jgi:hypothetical protein
LVPTASPNTVDLDIEPQVLTPCALDTERLSQVLDVEILEGRNTPYGYDGEYLCQYSTLDGVVLDVYVLPPVGYRILEVAPATSEPAPPEPTGIEVEITGATEAAAFFTRTGIDLRVQTETSHLVIQAQIDPTDQNLRRLIQVVVEFVQVLEQGRH